MGFPFVCISNSFSIKRPESRRDSKSNKGTDVNVEGMRPCVHALTILYPGEQLILVPTDLKQLK